MTCITLFVSLFYFFLPCFGGQDGSPFAFVPCFRQRALHMWASRKRERKKKLCQRSLGHGAPPQGGGQNTNVSTRTQMHEREVKNKGNSQLNEHALVTQKCFHQTPFQTCLYVSLPPPAPYPPPPYCTSDAASQHQ